MKSTRRISILDYSRSARYLGHEAVPNIYESQVSKYNENMINSGVSNNARKVETSHSQSYVKELHSARYNEFGIQMISHLLRRQLFKHQHIHTNNDTFKNCIKVLKKFNLGCKKQPYPEISFVLPELCGKNIEEHFYKIGEIQSSSYKNLICNLSINEIPPKPDKWVLEPGWTRYYNGTVESVPYPPDDALVFDVEVCKSEGEMPTLAVAVTSNAWYGWVSNSLVSGSIHYNKNNYTTDLLIPLESSFNTNFKDYVNNLPKKPRIIIGHNVSFDRSRVREQYWLKRSGLRFIDTLSLHVCISGITSYQKALLKAGVEGEEWSKLSSLNSLSKVHELYCGSKISKEERNIFVEGSLYDIRNEFQTLMTYCANDVIATFSVLKQIWPLFLSRFPHPVTLAGMLELQSAYVPVSENWEKYKSDSQLAFEDLTLESKYLLSQTAKSTCKLLHDKEFKKDLWMWDQDWSIRKLKLKKSSTQKEAECDTPQNQTAIDDVTLNIYNKYKSKFENILKTKLLLPARKPLLPGYPSWYIKLCEKPSIHGWIPGPNLINNGMQITPKLLRLKWKSFPLHYVRGNGWGFLVPFKTQISVVDNAPFEQFMISVGSVKNCQFSCSCDSVCKLLDLSDATELTGNSPDVNHTETFCKLRFGEGIGFVKLPHKDGKHLNVGSPLARDFITKFSDSDLNNTLSNAKRIIEISKMLSYWRNNKERIESQLVIWLYDKDFSSDFSLHINKSSKFGVILPLLIVSGTLTRRAVEPTWMTASNAVTDRVGSEFRGIIQSPPGYCFVGADVDSQELWIASLLGDAFAAGAHGCTPFGWMTLNGHKADNSDLHSVTAKTVGISRSHAKVLNYARIYGAGQKFAERTLLNFNPTMSLSEAKEKSMKMYQLTKGKKQYILKENVLPELEIRKYSRFQANQLCASFNKAIPDLFQTPKWFGGTESEMFNSLECIASKANPETPFLNCKLSRALEPNIDSEDKHGNTRINWVVQSSAVDFLHLMLVCMTWLMGNDVRFSISFHDEVRYLVPYKKKYQAALALQITNLLTRSFCVSKIDMTDLPLSVAFFSSVEIDSVLRKDSFDDNKTPSNPRGLLKGYGVPHGESLDINMCLEKNKI